MNRCEHCGNKIPLGLFASLYCAECSKLFPYTPTPDPKDRIATALERLADGLERIASEKETP